jgi:hypothetical protein
MFFRLKCRCKFRCHNSKNSPVFMEMPIDKYPAQKTAGLRIYIHSGNYIDLPTSRSRTVLTNGEKKPGKDFGKV